MRQEPTSWISPPGTPMRGSFSVISPPVARNTSCARSKKSRYNFLSLSQCVTLMRKAGTPFVSDHRVEFYEILFARQHLAA